MIAYLSSIARSGVVSIIALTSLATTSSFAAPVGPILNPSTPEGSSKPLPVAMGEGRDHGPGFQVWRPRMGGGWNGGGWNGGGRHWNGGGGHWNRGWHGGTADIGGNGWGGWGPGFALGLGLGLPLGYYGGGVPLGYYGGYDGYYDGYDGYYDQPPVYRPRVYRIARTTTDRYYNNYRYYTAKSTAITATTNIRPGRVSLSVIDEPRSRPGCSRGQASICYER